MGGARITGCPRSGCPLLLSLLSAEPAKYEAELPPGGPAMLSLLRLTALCRFTSDFGVAAYLTPTCVAHRELQEPSLGELARVIKAGACIEASFKRGKGEAGMDEYQVRTWEGWHHHMALT